MIYSGLKFVVTRTHSVKDRILRGLIRSKTSLQLQNNYMYFSRAFAIKWPSSTQINWSKKKRVHKKKVHDQHHCRAAVTSCENTPLFSSFSLDKDSFETAKHHHHQQQPSGEDFNGWTGFWPELRLPRLPLGIPIKIA